MKKLALLISVLCVMFMAGCSSQNVDYVKERAPETAKQVGFEITGYEGWMFGGPCALVTFGEYGGAYVYYIMKKVPDDGLLYEAYFQKWGNEIHVYELKPMNGANLNALKMK